MIINDRVYGKIEIKNKLIIDLINSKPMQRLKKIMQTGPTVLLEPYRNVTRFEHSIGVWYLLNKFGAGIKEQVAGLLHDTPHTAFSHVADVVFPNESHTFHEQFEERVILESEIPKILKKNKIEIKKIFDKSKFHLLEAELPDLSVDRIDYFLRDTRVISLFPNSLISNFLENLIIKNSKFCFKDISVALNYCLLFLDFGRILLLDAASHASHQILGETLKRALRLKVINQDDFFKTDDIVLQILQKLKDKEIKSKLKRLIPKSKFVSVEKNKAEFWGPNKPRVVDPYVLVKNKLIRISEIYPELNRIFTDFKNTYQFIGVKQV